MSDEEAEGTGSGHEAAAVDAERRHRLAKLDALREEGIEPYPPRFDREQMLAEVRERFGSVAAGERTGESVTVAGRLMLVRRHGGIDFAALRDRSDELQLVVERDISGEEFLKRFNDLDLGDWIGVTGEMICSDHGELSIEVREFELLSKSLRALPKEEHGPTDVDVRYRERYLDLIVNSRAREIFAIRSRTISEVRRTLLDRNFTEVETPVLDVSAGGAAARPFITHHNALDIDMYLRIALELSLKRLVVGGMERVFEIGRVFRNEGLDTRHNPEFTLLEAYQALGDYHEMLELTEELVAGVCERTLGHTTVKVGDRDLSLAKPFRRATMIELVKEHAGVDMHPAMPIEEARSIAKDLGIEIEQDWGAGRILAEAYDAFCEDKLFEPTFVMDHPREVSPLARAHRDDPTLTERFELVVAGRELANAYSELNDPIDQRSRFEAEARAKAAGDEEAEDVDEDYIRALEYGLPPTGGLGIGIDRLVMLLAEANTIREVILFPTMRPQGGSIRPPAGAPIADPASLPTPASLAPDPDPEEDGDEDGNVAEAVAAPTPRGHWGPARVLGWLTALIGIVSLIPSLPGVAGELGIDPFLNETGRVVTDVVSVLSGLVLIVVSRQLARGRKGAWQLAVAMFALSGLAHLARGPDPIAVALDGAMLLALLRWREHFRVPSDPRSLGALARFAPAWLGLVLLFGFGTLIAEREHIAQDLTVGNILGETFAALIGLDGPLDFTRSAPDDFFHAAALALAIAGLSIFLFLLFRPLAAGRGPSADDRAHARRLVRRWGEDSLAYFSLHEGKSYFFSSDGRAMIPYAYASGYALVAADPIGAPGSRERIIDEFLAFCRDRAWRVAFLAVREDHMPEYEERGFKGVYLGDEAIIRCDRFSLKGGTMKSVREAVNRVGREHAFRMIRETDASPDLIANLNEISAEWRGDNEERGFTMELARAVDGTEPDFLICLCLDTDERPVGFLRLVPCYGDDPGYSLDLMRRKPDAPNGLTEFLIANAALTLGERGFRRLSMNFAAWGRLFDTERPLGPMEKVQRSIASALNPYFQIESLRDFNQKFQPDWLPRSIAIEDTAQAPKVGLLYASVEGFVDVPGLSRLLAPSAAAQLKDEAKR